MRTFSIVTRINIALACIVTLALGTMMVSYWLSDRADSDAHAINVAGSLRMQSYRLAWLHQQQEQRKLQQALQQFTGSWQHPVFQRFLNQPEILQKYQTAQQHWQQLEPLLGDNTALPLLEQQLTEQVRLLDELVMVIQHDAEAKVKTFRSVQVIAVLATILLSIIVMYWLKVMVEEPLQELIRGARRIAQGDFTHRITPQHPDELGMLATSFNKMNTAIGYMYGNLEKRVEEQTAELTQTNTTLKFLYNTAQRISEHTAEYQDFSEIISQLRSITGLTDIELCLFTERGEQPYLQIQAADGQDPCAAENCVDCLSSAQSIRVDCQLHNFVLQRDRTQYGVLVVRQQNGQPLLLWQQRLVTAIADQLALALSLKSEEEQVRRLALMQERTVIARELHDSLAQALSYLKIQVTRLNKAIAKDDRAVMQDVSAELKSGLDAAYRQLRELLTTFRLKVDGAGLLSALQTTVQQLTEQSGLQIRLDYQLSNIPLAPNEEIHLLQIIREASQNAVHHSQGTNLTISLQQDSSKHILLAVEDDGIGIPERSEKMNHYGLAIMQERSKHLSGEIQIRRRTEGSTGVYFRFLPEYLQQPKSA
ncbi:MAG: type IV pili methyl-accepting chemotaxis transducer N-terminal domain-containing protein [Alishewanella agri]|nr:type IV pili methyl-accepting chemotaxis transducer N-terminal domain-containing protein [Alishewanella agri]